MTDIGGVDLLLEIQRKVNELETSIKQLRHTGREYAEAEREYKMLVNKKVLELRANDVAVGVINLTIYGYSDVALKRFDRDCKKVIYQANLEHINSTKLIIRILEAQLNREWSADLSD